VLKKLMALAGIAALCVSLAAVANAHPQVKHISSKVTLHFKTVTPATEYTESTEQFYGRVKSHKSCRKRREITIDGTDLSATTNSSGDYRITAHNTAPGTYTATAAVRNRKTNNGTKIVCEAATSDPVTVP